MNLDITATLLTLGDATSRNLEFSHRDNVWVTYGEETITETNLLEIRRRHPEVVRLHTFSKLAEAKNGADWEWHVVGRMRTLKMRVQAKRLQRNGLLRISHEVKSSRRQQRDLLIDGARDAKMKAVYCVYCSEPQREIWKQPQAPPGYRVLQPGCLLADAAHVPEATKRLSEIEERCRPWHHLFLPTSLRQAGLDFFLVDVESLVQAFLTEQPPESLVRVGPAMEPSEAPVWNPPTVDDLNGETGREFDPCGVAKTTDEDRVRLEPSADTEELTHFDEKRLKELGIARMMVIDVRGDSESP